MTPALINLADQPFDAGSDQTHDMPPTARRVNTLLEEQ